MRLLAMSGLEAIGSVGGAAAVILALGMTLDRLVKTVGGLVITYRVVFSGDDRPVRHLQLMQGSPQLADQKEAADFTSVEEEVHPGQLIDGGFAYGP